jgi:CO/xanthine dehydrogenase FAD-binding subunit
MVLGASVKIVGPSGERVLSISEFYRSDGIDSHELRPGEILSEVLLPQAAAELRVRYWKLRPRSAMDFPEAGVAVAVNADASGELRVALGALGSRPIGLVKSTAEIDATQPLELANRLWRELKPQTDTVRNSVFRPYYRKEMARLQLGKLLQELL